MTILIISIIVAWIIFSATLVTILCMFSSKINQQRERLARAARMASEARE